MKAGLTLGLIVTFIAGMAAAVMLGNALFRSEHRAAELALAEADASHRERIAAQDAESKAELIKAAKAAQDWLDKDEFLHKLNEANRRIASAVEPSVVHLRVTKFTIVTSQNGRRTFRRADPGTGSGWVFALRDPAGNGDGGAAMTGQYIVTNAHVIGTEVGRRAPARGEDPEAESEPPRIIVSFSNGSTHSAKVVGVDAPTDIAVLSVDAAAPLVPARLATDDPVQQGDRVYAFGSPFGFKFSMSQGIISGLSRDPSGPREDTYTNYLQTDAAVNPGNSGGPLCDIHGRVVGMNVAIAAESVPQQMVAASRGVGFAIPLSTIEPIVEQIIRYGKVSKGFLGVNLPEDDENNESLLKAAEYPGLGVLVRGVVIAAPAAAAGIMAGDVITAINGKDIRSLSQFRALVATRRPGEQLRVRVWRAGESREVTALLADLGIANAAFDEALARVQTFGFEVSAGTPLEVSVVGDETRAKEIGLSRGTQIRAVGPHEVRTLSDFLWALVAEGFHEGKPVTLTVSRDGVSRKVQMDTASK